MRTTRIPLALLGWALFVCPAHADKLAPMINRISPCAVQVGQTAECEITSAYSLFGATAVQVTGEGVIGEVMPVELKPGEKPPPLLGEGRIRVRFQAAPDAAPGIRDVRLQTPRGPSTLGPLIVVRDPVVREQTAPHNTLETAQSIVLPATVCGRIEAKEEVDYYKFQVAAGTGLTFHMICQRLQRKLSPVNHHAAPMVALRNASGAILASNDNFYSADPLLHYRFEKTGEYYLEVRDVRYLGYRYWEYAIEIHDRPFVLQTVPVAVAPGEPTRVRLVGYNLPDDAAVTLRTPADAADGEQWVTLPPWQGKPLNPVPVFVSRLPVVTESATPHDTTAQAQVISVPAGIRGVIEKPEEVDCYAFEARKGEHFTVSVAAHSLRSELDSYIRILNAKGESLIENDDASELVTRRPGYDAESQIVSPDSRIEDWVAPADGRYAIEIRDVHLRGGKHFPYLLQVRRSEPYFSLDINNDRTVLAPGVSTVIFVRAFRKEGFTGDIDLRIEGLPRGVTATCGRIAAGCHDGCILLETAADASREMANIRVIGTATSGTGSQAPTLTVVARPMQELQGPYPFLTPTSLHTVGVADSLDLKAVCINPKTLTLKPGESKTIEVTIERSPDFKETVTLVGVHRQHYSVYGNCLPPGVTVDENASKIRLVDDQLKGTLVLKAAANAKPVERVLIPVMAIVPLHQFSAAKMIYCAEPCWLTVESVR